MAESRRFITPAGSGSRTARSAASSRMKSLLTEDRHNHASPRLRDHKNGVGSGSATRHRLATPRGRPPLPAGTASTPRPRRSTPAVPVGGSVGRRANSSLSHTNGELSEDPLLTLAAVQAETVALSVSVRVRPLDSRDELHEGYSLSGDVHSILVKSELHPPQRFHYNNVFWSMNPEDAAYASQSHVYESVASPLLDSVLEGFNVCLLAYGQTGSGKTYSMMGKVNGEQAGITPRFCRELFLRISNNNNDGITRSVQISYYEIYNERIRDLLADGGASLRVREHPDLGPHVAGLHSPTVSNWHQTLDWIEAGNRRRATASTAMNNKSSRSHSVLTLSVITSQTESVDGDMLESKQTALVNLVDLAGSERVAQAQTSGLRHKEGVRINMSLLALGKVITALTDPAVNYIPYRESNLTWLLKESLGGNSRTAMLATVSACRNHAEETLATLRYACIAGKVVNSVHANEDPHSRLIRQLRDEVERLRQEQMLTATPSSAPTSTPPSAVGSPALLPAASVGSPALLSAASVGGTDSPTAVRSRLAIAQLKRRLQHNLIQLKSRDKELLQAKQQLVVERQSAAACSGVPFTGQMSTPSLVILLPDPSLSEMVAYPLAEGTSTLGRGPADTIVLQGLTLQEKHCKLECHNNRVHVMLPSGGESESGAIYINGRAVSGCSSVQLQHGDRLVLAGEVFLRLHLPARGVLGLGGFSVAKQELDRYIQQRAVEEQQVLKERVRSELLGEIQEEEMDHRLDLHVRKTNLQREIQLLDDQLKQLQDQKLTLNKELPAQNGTSSADVIHYSPCHSDFLQRVLAMSDCTVSAKTSEVGCGDADVTEVDAALIQDIMECNALLRRLGRAVSVEQDYELEADGTLRVVVLITDREHDIYTVWDPNALSGKLHLLRSICEAETGDFVCDLTAVLDSRTGWQQLRHRRRSHNLSRRCTASSTDSSGKPLSPGDVRYEQLASSLSRLVHECADWRSDNVAALLTAAAGLSSQLHRLQQLSLQPFLGRPEQAMRECLRGLIGVFSRLSSCFAVWRRCNRRSDDDQCYGQLEQCMDCIENQLGFVYTGVATRNSSLTDASIGECDARLVRLCRLLGAVQLHDDGPMELVEAGTIGYYIDGVLMALDHSFLDAVTLCEETEAELSGLADDSVVTERTGSGPLYASAHELVACLRYFLQQCRSIQTELQRSGAAPSSHTPVLYLSALRALLAELERIGGAVRHIYSALRAHHADGEMDGEAVQLSTRHLYSALAQCARRFGGAPCQPQYESTARNGTFTSFDNPTLQRYYEETQAACVGFMSQLTGSDVTTSQLTNGSLTSSLSSSSVWSESTTTAAAPASFTQLLSLPDLSLNRDAVQAQVSLVSLQQMSLRLRHAVQLLEQTPSKSNLRRSGSEVSPTKRVHFFSRKSPE